MVYPDPSYAANLTNWEDTSMNAVECSLSLCAKVYSSAVEKGSLTENTTASFINPHSKLLPTNRPQ